MNNFIMMIGLPASGKSTYAKSISEKENAVILSSDELREELFGDRNEQGKNNELFTELSKRTKELLTTKNVIFDATNVNYKQRRAFLTGLGKVNCKKVAILMATPYETCIERNKIREHKVPEEVIKRMYEHFYVPYYYEGFDEIRIKNSFYYLYGYPLDICKHYGEYNQNNHNHTLTLGKHLEKAFVYAVKNGWCDIAEACLLHDCGKPRVASFSTIKGEKTNDCHYYNHDNTSAYDSLFYCCSDFKSALKRAVLIQWHMLPYFATEKSEKKFRKLFGNSFYDDILKIHAADKYAH